MYVGEHSFRIGHVVAMSHLDYVQNPSISFCKPRMPNTVVPNYKKNQQAAGFLSSRGTWGFPVEKYNGLEC